mmetsp:Transcript_17148/g.32469  ORF Transcript_17148/g.32469 Transcript_17148/m.32469 type:complete len:424 (-) Transcript_17148:1503-2774(-)|eukprot:CAMPEP_0176503090 /NCGR_PEP_ID=MMETSP0200_2-20121128/15146_1 /TAXON_ID=947934 /ORGANISM="Chaetoceros sp., Strain GSL56" /LENGTH=423 /DNA_ID=CAMNT_0017902295 /DNA_START=158 /DNA_END=1429 /DNA_ORIENTATION=+
MSAYALPGSFFFPSTLEETSDVVAAKNDLPDKTNSSNSNKGKEPWYNSNDLLISIKSASIDHIRLIQGFTARRSSTSSRRSSFRDRVASLSNSLSGFSLASSFTEGDEHCWGEYMDEEEHEQEQEENHSYTDDSKLHSSPRERKVQFQFDEIDTDASNRRESVKSLDASFCAASVIGEQAAYPTLRESSAQSNSQDDAIQFTLSITFNGRKYTATRALPSFIKLRQDLMQELEKKKNSPSRLTRSGLSNSNVDGSRKVETSLHPDTDALHQDDREVIIPELPIGGNAIDSDTSSGLIGMAGRGFRGLQDTVKNYCPPMEHWIRSVAALVPSSPTLANFLWEPLHSNQENHDDVKDDGSSANTLKLSQVGNRVSLRNSMRGSVQTLISITESVDTDSDGGSEVEKDVTREDSLLSDGKEDFIVN